MKVKILKKTGDAEVETIVDVPVDKNGKPLSRFWRKRLADAKLDNNIQVIQDGPKADPQKTAKSEKK